MAVDDAGQKLMGVPLPQGLDAGCSWGCWCLGWGLAAGASPRALVIASSHPAGKEGVLQKAGERRRKQEVDVAWEKIRWKRGN